MSSPVGLQLGIVLSIPALAIGLVLTVTLAVAVAVQLLPSVTVSP